MYSINLFIQLLEKLEEKNIHYKLNKTRNDCITIEASVPGQRWEIDYNTYGETSGGVIEIEKFLSEGIIRGEEELEVLFRDFSD